MLQAAEIVCGSFPIILEIHNSLQMSLCDSLLRFAGTVILENDFIKSVESLLMLSAAEMTCC